METNLKTAKGREEAIRKIENEYIDELRSNNFELHQYLTCYMFTDRIAFEFKNKVINVYLITNNKLDIVDAGINISTGSLINQTDESNYWKVIHAATILKNWEKFIEITNKYHKQYLELLNKIFNYG
jgi:hypothetical protein